VRGWPMLVGWRAKLVLELARFPGVLGFCRGVCARLYGMRAAMVLWAKAFPDLVGAGDGGAHGRLFPPWGRCRGARYAPSHEV
jgi:hypothetical protein